MLTRRTFLSGALLGLASSSCANADDYARSAPIVVTGFRGTVRGDPEVETVCRLLEAGEIAGVILLRRNVVSPDQVLKLTLAFREAAGSFVPIISVDQEGGTVARLDAGNGFTDWMSAAEVARELQTETELFEYYLTRTRELASVGINVNFGPVLDLNRNPMNPIIGRLKRSFGIDTEVVVRCASSFVDAHREAGLMTCCKHFPGHGSSATDSHLVATDITWTWSEDEFVPYQELQATGRLDTVMTSHLIHDRFSDDRAPVSLSSSALVYIRETLGFTGPVFTDDMQMAAVTSAYAEDAAAVAAVAAGNTFLVYANHTSDQDIGTAARINSAIASALSTRALDPSLLEKRATVASAFLERLH